MDLNTAQIFTIVATELSFTKAAAQLKMPKQTVSRRIAELEKELKCRLLERSTRAITLSPEGKLFLEYAKQIVALSTEARTAISQFKQEPVGSLSILCSAEFCALQLRHVFLQFMRSNPKVTLRVSLMQDLTVQRIEDFDLVIRSNSSGELPSYAQYPSETLATLGYSLVASPRFLKNQRLKEPSDLETLPFIAYQPSPEKCLRFQHSEQGVMSIIPMPVLETDSFWLAWQACVDGLGIACFPTYFIGSNIQNGQLVPLFPAYSMPDGSLQLLYPRQGIHAPALRKLSELLRIEFANFATEYFKPEEANRFFSDHPILKAPDLFRPI